MGSAVASAPPAVVALVSFVRRITDPFAADRTWLALAYVLTSLPIGVAGALVLAMGLPLAVALLALGLTGIPALILILAIIDLLCRLQRACTAALADVRVPAPPPEPLTRGAWWRPSWRGLLGPRRWLQAAAVLALAPVQVAAFLVVMTFWAAGLALAALPAYMGPGVGVQFAGQFTGSRP